MENNPFLGYVGERYFFSKTKICFVGKAGGESRHLTAADMRMNEKFVAFKKSAHNDREETFYAYQRVVCAHIQTWNVYKIPEYLNGLIGQDIYDIAYLNILPFRYIGEPPKSVFKVAWCNFTNKALHILEPDYIVPLGKRLHEEIRANYSGDAEVTDGITRTNGDNYLHNDAINHMTNLANRIIK